MTAFEAERIDTVVIGGGQSGLSAGYHLRRRGVPFVILDAHDRIGDAWRHRWDSLRLFTPAHMDGLDGMAFPAKVDRAPTKDEMADFLESYAERFELPVRLGVRVDRLSHDGERFMVAAGDELFAANNVVIAMSGWQVDKVPSFAAELDSSIAQIPSSQYRRASDLPWGSVLVVGAANSGAEIALDLARDRDVWLAGRHPGHVPFDVDSWFGRTIGTRLVAFAFQHVFTRTNPIGRKMIRSAFGKGMPLVRTKPSDVDAAGVRTIGRIEGVRDGKPMTADGEVVEPDAIVWACGYTPGFTWIDLDVLEDGYPRHDRGVSTDMPGLYFVGLPFLYAVSSHTIHGIGRDAEHVVRSITQRRARDEVAAGRSG